MRVTAADTARSRSSLSLPVHACCTRPFASSSNRDGVAVALNLLVGVKRTSDTFASGKLVRGDRLKPQEQLYIWGDIQSIENP